MNDNNFHKTATFKADAIEMCTSANGTINSSTEHNSYEIVMKNNKCQPPFENCETMNGWTAAHLRAFNKKSKNNEIEWEWFQMKWQWPFSFTDSFSFIHWEIQKKRKKKQWNEKEDREPSN